MAHEESSGGGGKGFASGTINLPVIGPAKKKVVFAVAGAGGVFVLWRYWQSSQAGAGPESEAAGDSDGDGFADGGILPSVSGAVRPDNGYGQNDGSAAPSTDTYGFTGITNSQWSQYATTQLTGSDVWSYTDIVTALGQYLAGKPLTAVQQEIVQAAKAIAGNPPEGEKAVIPGGNVPITVAPSTLTATAVDSDSVDLKWPVVAGAESYRIYRSGSTSNVGTSLDGSARIDGLQPGTGYTFYVAAVSSSGKVGPKSAGAKATTKEASLKAPTGLRVTKRTKSTVSLSWNKTANASGYRIYHNLSASNAGSSVDSVATVGGLKANTKYTWHVRAVDNNGKTGPTSATVSGYTTK